LVLPGYVEDDVLITLYSNAELFVFPSLHEGFGLPLLEAMSCGVPAIGSNCTSVPEVIGLDDALFDPLDVSAIRDKMARSLSDPAFARHLSEHARTQTKRFAWEVSAERAWAALDRLHGMPAKAENTAQSSSTNPLHPLIAAMASIDGPAPTEATVLDASRCIVFNHGVKTPQLLLDVSELAKGDARSGIQRVVRSILRECLNTPPAGFEIRPIRFDGTRYWYANQLATSMLEGYTPTEDTPADFFQDDVYLCLDLLMHLGASLHEAHRDLSVRGVSMNYLVYDLLPLQSPEWWPPDVHPQFHQWITELGRNADRMVCISRAVADELTMWLAQHPPERVLRGPRVASFHLGADVHNSLPSKGMPDNAQTLLDQLRRAVNFLMVSTIEPRKGHDQALSAFEQLWAQGHEVNLVIVGKRGWKVDELVERLSNHAENGGRLHWLEGVSDEYLEQVYAASDCLVLASHGEGFGLPLIEAAQHGLSILARDLPVLREVAGEHAYYFSGLRPEDLAQAVESWLQLKKCGQQPDSNAIPWLTWKQSAQQLLDALGIPTPSSTTPA
jgi:glycosyltransferase involved in cell wall biosynthesis